jgi:hypothetical protein
MSKQKKNPTILLLCLVAGTLDAIAAILMSLKYPAASVFKFIASGWFGKAALEGGTIMVIWGLIFHYLIASSYCILFFFLYPRFKRLIKNKIAIAIIISLLIRLVMNFIVLPMSNIPKGTEPFSIISFVISILVLSVAVGAPIVIFADRYYKDKVD